MDKSILHAKLLSKSRFFLILITLLLFGCQAEEPAPPDVSLEGLSPIKQGYLQSGLIELINDDLTPPIIPENPTQADLGSETYYQVCMACHGNWGQGLTDEWRETGFGEDMNCWQSKCHAPNHPPQGFEFPKVIPPLLGRGALGRLSDAQQLFQIISETMPWWNPGDLSLEESLNLTAYIMRARSELPEGIVLSESNLGAFPLHVQAPEIVDQTPVGIILIIGLSVAMLSFLWIKRFPDTKN